MHKHILKLERYVVKNVFHTKVLVYRQKELRFLKKKKSNFQNNCSLT